MLCTRTSCAIVAVIAFLSGWTDASQSPVPREKLDLDGFFSKHSHGTTAVADIEDAEKFGAPILAALKTYPRISKYFAFLPPSSYHMTTIPGLPSQGAERSDREFRDFLQINEGKFMEAAALIDNANFSARRGLKFYGISNGATALTCRIRIEGELREELTALGTQVRALFGSVWDPFYTWHMTVGYHTIPVPILEQLPLTLEITRFFNEHIAHLDVNLEPQHLCEYEGMEEFVPCDGREETFLTMAKPVDEYGFYTHFHQLKVSAPVSQQSSWPQELASRLHSLPSLEIIRKYFAVLPADAYRWELLTVATQGDSRDRDFRDSLHLREEALVKVVSLLECAGFAARGAVPVAVTSDGGAMRVEFDLELEDSKRATTLQKEVLGFLSLQDQDMRFAVEIAHEYRGPVLEDDVDGVNSALKEVFDIVRALAPDGIDFEQFHVCQSRDLRECQQISGVVSELQPFRRKLDSRGYYLQFPGNTVVCDAVGASSRYAVVETFLRSHGVLQKYYSALPASSYHMTLFDMFVQEDMHDDEWEAFISQNAPIWQEVQRLLSRQNIAPRARPVSLSDGAALSVAVELLTQSGDAAEMRRQLADVTGAADSPSYWFHTTLAYRFRDIRDEDKLAVEKALAELLQVFTEAAGGVVILEPASLRTFVDMTAFDEWDGTSPVDWYGDGKYARPREA